MNTRDRLHLVPLLEDGEPTAAPPARRRALIAALEEPYFLLVRLNLGADGWEVDCARTLDQAEALAVHDVYQMVILDLSLSSGDVTAAVEFVNVLCTWNPRTHVVVMAPDGAPDAESELRFLGVSAYLSGPTPLPRLLGLVASLPPR